ncbi:glycosyltransferase [Sphingomonas sp. BGYR3]|uniref:glycosyltransferase family protein n=1 Tax=Sphingomonas sp. BGYR3 TaxID=2975483 RepID=UPI0021A94F32|nr:glycosyltransferase [Sphingomonas sp. BGYR3]MDG5489267.1 glycosyltransferase [Sphingomonas sp. BGYR3]
MNQLRLALLSNEKLHPELNWTTLAPPMFSGLSALVPTETVAPEPFSWDRPLAMMEQVRQARTCDFTFGLQRSSRLETPLLAIANLALGTRKSVFVIDPWRHMLSKLTVSIRAQNIAACFIPYKEAFAILKGMPGGDRVHYLPFGIDTKVFTERKVEKDVDIFWMGRRYAPLHNAIERYCDAHNLTYLYREKTGPIEDPQELGRLVSRSRYFVATPPDLDDPARTGGFSPLVMRYFEGLAAGTRLLGVLPRSGEFEDFVPRESLLAVAPDGSDFAEKFEADQQSETGWNASRAAAKTVRNHHSFDARAKEIVRVLGTL